jgi:hypothetical protein
MTSESLDQSQMTSGLARLDFREGLRLVWQGGRLPVRTSLHRFLLDQAEISNEFERLMASTC